jgi:hypothetical protein
LNVERRKQFLRFIAVPWRKLYRRDLLEGNSIRFPVGDYFYEDNPFHWFAILSASSLVVVPDVLCYHRVARAGQTMTADGVGLFKMFEHHDTIRAWLVERGLEQPYAPSLVGWVVAQLEWIALRTPPDLRSQLLETVRPILSAYSKDTIEAALCESEKGVLARQLTAAVVAGDRRRFAHALDKQSASSGLLSKTLRHVRYSGVRQTVRIAARYTSARVDRLAGQLPVLRDRRDRITTRDLMFGLAVLQRRLTNVERMLRELQTDGRTDPGDGPAVAEGHEARPL